MTRQFFIFCTLLTSLLFLAACGTAATPVYEEDPAVGTIITEPDTVLPEEEVEAQAEPTTAPTLEPTSGATIEATTEATESIAAIAVGDPEFTTLVAALEAAGLTDVLAGDGSYTVFAPTNAAFDAALTELGMTSEELLADTETLNSILLYHVLDDEVMEEAVVALDGGAVETLEGSTVQIAVTDEGVLLNDTAAVTTTNIVATNGVIHVIDMVLLPPTFEAAPEATTEATAEMTPEATLDVEVIPEDTTEIIVTPEATAEATSSTEAFIQITPRAEATVETTPEEVPDIEMPIEELETTAEATAEMTVEATAETTPEEVPDIELPIEELEATAEATAEMTAEATAETTPEEVPDIEMPIEELEATAEATAEMTPEATTEAAEAGGIRMTVQDLTPEFEPIAPEDDPLQLIVSIANVENGETLFNETFNTSSGAWMCSTCHNVDNDEVKIGPSLWGIPNRANKRVEGQGPYTYIYNSIHNSQEYIVPGYEEGTLMPVYGPHDGMEAVLTDAQIYDLVAYLMTLERPTE